MAQTGLPARLRDIGTVPQPAYAPLLANPHVFARLGDELFFAFWEPTDGLELRASTGLLGSFRTVRDICPGSCHGFWIFELVESGGVLFFVGDDGVHGRELWRSDGTSAGTAMVADIVPGLDRGADPQFLTPAPGGVYFSADDGVHGRELWWSGGTEGTTHLVADLLPGGPDPADLGPSHLTWLPGKGLVFSADDGVHGREPWLTNGSEASTLSLADVLPGAGSGLGWYSPFPGRTPDVAAAGVRVFFPADDGLHGIELWATDGTPAGTGLVADIASGSDTSHLRAFHAMGSTLLFAAGPPGAATLWRSDGTVGGTYPLGDVAHGSDQLSPTVYADFGPQVYFGGYQPATGRELWKTDGTLAGTQLAVDVLPGPASGVQTLDYLATAANWIFFPGTNGKDGVEWWQHNPIPATFQIDDLMPGPASSVDFVFAVTHPAAAGAPGEQRVLLGGFDPVGGWGVWSATPGSTGLDGVRSAGDRPGSLQLCTLWNCPPQFVPWGGGVAFGAYEAVHGLEPWRSDDTDAGTSRVADIAPGINSSLFPITSFKNLAPLGDDLLLLANDCSTSSCPSSSVQLWRATIAGTLTKLSNGSWTYEPGDLASWNGAGYFAAEDAVWRSDGTPGGTGPLGGAGFARWFTPGASRLYFVASTGGLWKTDGTPAGTVPIIGPTPFAPGRPVLTDNGAGGEILYFAAADGVAGNELWTSDGTDGGTRRVVDLRAGTGGSIPTPFPPGFEEPSLLAALGPLVFFAADDGFAGEELWVSNGTPGNATLLEVRPGPAGSQPRSVTAAGGRVYFVADDGVHGREPWVTDGTPGGTHLLADVRPGSASSTPRELVDWMGRLVFAADDDVHGMELWRAEPDGAGAQLVADLSPGVAPSSPQGLTAVGERLYFFADDGTSGLEPWLWSAAAEMFKDGFETGNVTRWSRAFSF